MKSLIFRNSENLRYYRSHFLLFIYLSVFLTISSVPVFLSLKISSILLLQVVVGQEIYGSISKRVQVSTIERMAMGFSIGSLVWLLVDQILLWISLSGIGWLLISLQIIFVLWVNHRRADENSGLFRISFEAVGWLTVASLFGLSGEWVWPLPLAVVGAALLLANHRFLFGRRRDLAVLATLIAIGSCVTVLATRPKIWWITQTDQHFYQAISSSLAKWGFNDNTLSSGFRLSYHWFPYAWSGLVQRLSDAPDWIVITRVGPIIATLCIVSLVWVISRRMFESKNVAALSVMLFATSSVSGDLALNIDLAMFGSYSQLFATIWLLPILLWMIDADRRTISSNSVLVSILLVGMVGGKVSHAAIALVCVLGFESFRFITFPELRKSCILHSAVALTTVLVTTLLLFGNDGSISFRFLTWVSYVQGDLYQFVQGEMPGFSRWKLFLLAGALLLGILFATVATIFGGFVWLRRQRAIFFALICSVVVGVVLSNFSSGPSGPNGLFFVHSSIMLAVALSGSTIWQSLQAFPEQRIKARMILVLALATVLYLTVNYLIPSQNLGTSTAAYLRTSRSLSFMAGVFLIVVVCAFQKKNRRLTTSFGATVLVFLLGLSSVSFLAKSVMSFEKNYSSFATNGQTYVASVSLEEVARWFENETLTTDIYASNYLCDETSCGSPDYSTKSLMSALINRRSLVQAPYFAAAYTRDRNSVDAAQIPVRIEASTSFASSPTRETLSFLIQQDVRWYVVDKTVAKTNWWQKSDSVVFGNEEFLVIDLDTVELEP